MSGAMLRATTIRNLLAGTDRDAIVAWLVWCDPNGLYLDDWREAEDLDPLTLEEARVAMRAICTDNEIEI